MTKATQSDPVRSLDNIRPQSVKVGLPSDQIGLNYVAEHHQAILDYYGSVKATAYALGEGATLADGTKLPKLDESLMQREFRAGNFSRFNVAEPNAKAFVSERMNERFGTLKDPKAYAMSLIEAGEKAFKELRQYVLESRIA